MLATPAVLISEAVGLWASKLHFKILGPLFPGSIYPKHKGKYNRLAHYNSSLKPIIGILINRIESLEKVLHESPKVE